ncbi:hypothetical protein BGZ57DRAFT_775095, partial [Hyaloscypha finlandica]
GIYWINRKPASGKLTLMKRIYDNRRTREHLEIWSRRIIAGTRRARPYYLAIYIYIFFGALGRLYKRAKIVSSIPYYSKSSVNTRISFLASSKSGGLNFIPEL